MRFATASSLPSPRSPRVSSSRTGIFWSTASVNIPSYLVKDNDTIEVTEKSKQLAVVLDSTQSNERDVSAYLEVNHRTMKGRFAWAPKLSDVPYPVQIESNLVVAFYSR